MTFLSNGKALSGTSPSSQYPASNPAILQPAPAIVPAAPDLERLYALLPGIYRLRDAAQGEQLRALLAIIESELRLIEGDLEALYENWFIETCEDWIVPYLGDLLAVSDLNAGTLLQFGQERRAYVANTLFYRQRKGTTPVLEQLARDITGWGARAVESLQLVAATQNVNHLRLQSQTAMLRPPRLTEFVQPALDRLATPFETAAYTTQIRPTWGDRLRYNPASVALYLWRLQPYSIENAAPRAVKGPHPAPQGDCFTFNPLGFDRVPLFNLPQTETELTTLAQEENLPGILTSALLKRLMQIRDPDRLPVQVRVNDQLQPFEVGDLSQWQSIAPLTIDPERGRLRFQTSDPPQNVTVSYGEGFSGDIGAGTYERFDAITEQPPIAGQIIWKVPSADKLKAAVKTWNQYARKWQHCYDLVNFPVARLAVTGDGLKSTDSIQPPRMRAGILQGLQPIVRLGEIDLLITPGLAIDRQGQQIQVNFRHRVSLGCYPNQTVLLTISRLSWQPYWRIRAIPQQNGTADRAENEIPVVEVTIDRNGRITRSRTSVRERFQPGFSGDFKLSIVLSAGSQPTLSLTASADAFAVNRSGQKIRLDRVKALTLPENPPRTILLFIAPVQSREAGKTESGKLDFVPDTDRAVIELQGNRTLKRNLGLQIPAEKRLYLVASSGDRPHLCGNITLRGMAMPDTENGGDFCLDGLLVEGRLTVAPGNLQRLTIAHSTLVPQQGGLIVEKAEYELFDQHTDDVTLLALLMYSLTLLRRLLRTGLADNGLTTPERIAQMAQIFRQQIATLAEGIEYFGARYIWRSNPAQESEDEDASEDSKAKTPAVQEGLCQPPEEPVNLDEDNSFLAIRIDRSICGRLDLADTVPILSLAESILDSVTAAGADADIQKSTLLGAVQVRSLEAAASLFRSRVTVARRQVGCLRFCYLPAGSQTPKRFRCQPDLLLAQAVTPAAAITALASDSTTQQTFAGTTNGVLRFLSSSQRWVPLTGGMEALNVTALLPIEIPGRGTISGDRDSVQLIGSQTRFTQELQSGDRIFVQGRSLRLRQIDSDQTLTLDQPLSIDLPAGTRFAIVKLVAGTASGQLFQTAPVLQAGAGSLSVMGSQIDAQVAVLGCQTNFTAAIVGGSLTVGNETRLIVGFESETRIAIESAFSQDVLHETYLIQEAEAAPRLGEGTVSSTRDRSLVAGCRTRFQRDVQMGDELLVLDENGIAIETRTVIAIESDTALRVDTPLIEHHASSYLLQRSVWMPLSIEIMPPVNTRINALIQFQNPGTRTITSAADLVTGDRTQFTQIFTVGDTIAVADLAIEESAAQAAPALQIRKILAVLSDTQLKIDAPFDADLTQPAAYWIPVMLAATAGNGVIRSTDFGQTWKAANQGLTNQEVRAIVYQDSKLFAGTFGSGVFRSIDGGITWTGGDPIDPEVRQTGLTVPSITCFAVNSLNGDLFAGTTMGLFRSSDGGDRWQSVSQGLPDLPITALAQFVQPGTGTIASRNRIVTGSETRFQAELQPQDTLILNGQTRRIRQISADPTVQQLVLNDAFDPDLPPGTNFQQLTLLAGTADGTVYRSRNNGRAWEAIAQLTETAISAFAVQDAQTPVLFAATQIGSLYCSRKNDQVNGQANSQENLQENAQDSDRQNSSFRIEESWSAINSGIPGIEETLLILNRLQPRFTSEQYGEPTFAQLSSICPIEIRTGAEDGSEMGAFGFLKQSQREANLQASLREYLRFGLQADILDSSYSLKPDKSETNKSETNKSETNKSETG